MAHRITWARRALQDLEAITTYIATDSPAYAKTVARNIVNQTKVLGRFPRVGKIVSEFDDETIREILVYSYRVIYQVEEDKVVVVAGGARQTHSAIGYWITPIARRGTRGQNIVRLDQEHLAQDDGTGRSKLPRYARFRFHMPS